VMVRSKDICGAMRPKISARRFALQSSGWSQFIGRRFQAEIVAQRGAPWAHFFSPRHFAGSAVQYGSESRERFPPRGQGWRTTSPMTWSIAKTGPSEHEVAPLCFPNRHSSHRFTESSDHDPIAIGFGHPNCPPTFAVAFGSVAG